MVAVYTGAVDAEYLLASWVRKRKRESNGRTWASNSIDRVASVKSYVAIVLEMFSRAVQYLESPLMTLEARIFCSRFSCAVDVP